MDTCGSGCRRAERWARAEGPDETRRLTARALRRMRRHSIDAGVDELTGQERRILDLVGEGLTNRQIAERMGLAEKTVKNHVSNILGKLGLARRTQAAAYVVGHQSPGYARAGDATGWTRHGRGAA